MMYGVRRFRKNQTWAAHAVEKKNKVMTLKAATEAGEKKRRCRGGASQKV